MGEEGLACEGRWKKEDQERQSDLPEVAEQGTESSRVIVVVMTTQSESVARSPWSGTVPSLSMY